MVDSDSTVTKITDAGTVIFNRRDDILLACVPTESLETVLSLPGLITAEAGGDVTSCLDKARPMGLVDAVQSGDSGLPCGYDGSGVVVGFSDTGFDPSHIAFSGRISAIYDYDSYSAIRRTAETPEEIAAWRTDTPDETHATHVANILAGGYKGNGYYGVATSAEIVATTSELSDVGILAGVEDIIRYARERDKRCVINLSLASFLGPHDGTDLFCKYLERCADDAVICLAAGNKALATIYAYCTLNGADDLRRVTVNDLTTATGFATEGITEFWSAGPEPFDIRLEVSDYDTREVVWSTQWVCGNDGPAYIHISSTDTPEWGQFLDGDLWLQTGTDPLNGRFTATVMYDTKSSYVSEISQGKWSKYFTAIAVRGCEGENASPVWVDIFADGSQSVLGYQSRDNAPTFSAAGTISDMCCANGILAVGNASSRNTAPLLDGGEITWDFETGTICKYSSYSDVPTIARLPHISAPGNYVVSAASSYYIAAHPEVRASLSARADVDGTDYYWMPMAGTSMSSPYVAGVMALWLQANPYLSGDELKEIACGTAITNYPDISNPAWGAGEINALEGLRDTILGIHAPGVDTPPLVETFPDRTLRITVAGGDTGSVAVTSINGVPVDWSHPLNPGVYIVTAPGMKTVKIAVK